MQSSPVIIITLAQLQRRATQRPNGYLQTVLAAGDFDGEQLVLTEPAYLALKAKYGGLGDRIALWIHRLGFRKWKGCGCARRQAWLNRLGARIRSLFSL